MVLATYVVVSAIFLVGTVPGVAIALTTGRAWRADHQSTGVASPQGDPRSRRSRGRTPVDPGGWDRRRAV